jgi:dihydropteroate synthase
MGILNVTPDSFSDGGLFLKPDRAVARGLELLSQGADIIDIGGESARPGSDPVSLEEERKRVLPVIKELRKKTDRLISIDTTKSGVARAALEAGADIINDISGLRFDPAMISLAAESRVPVIVMHMLGRPKTMQDNPCYDDVVSEVKDFFEERIESLKSRGIAREHIIIDPGIGFGKRQEDNLALLNNLASFQELDRPLLVGTSRKSFLGRILDLEADQRLEGTISSSLLSVINGAHILRVHDVEPIRRALQVAEAIWSEGAPNVL